MGTLADRKPGRAHKTENDKEDEQYGECRGHNVYHKRRVPLLCGCGGRVSNHVCGFVLLTYLNLHALSNQANLQTSDDGM
jgi:hypothetical protein